MDPTYRPWTSRPAGSPPAGPARPRRTVLGIAGTLALALGTVLGSAAVVATGAGPAAGVTVSEIIPVGTATALTVQYRGNGHGHGMSQYGARGAARAGLGYAKILAFYYPGTTLTTLSRRLIRVKLPNTGRTTTISARTNVTVTGVSGYLPTTGVAKYRLIAGAGTTLTLQKLANTPGAAWTTVRTGLANRSEFHRSGGPLRVYESDGQSTDYDGYLRAVRSGSGVFTVDRVMLDRYVAGVVPREMPASWETAAVQAQAVAARTYAANALANPSSTEYDICATTQCQVFGGRAHYDAHGYLLTKWDTPPVTATSYQVLTYQGRPAFAQFSASNGGWTVAGGQPYLVAKADPYDTPARSLDPYVDVSTKVRVSTLAAAFGLAKVTAISITSRDGHGVWTGRVLTGSVLGVDKTGHQVTVPAQGYDFANAFGLGTTWFKVSVATG